MENMKIYNAIVGAKMAATIAGTDNYNQLSNQPKINNVTLTGNKTSSDLGLQPTIDSSHKLNPANINFSTAQTNVLSNIIIESDKNLYISATEPTGDIPAGSTWINGKIIKTYAQSDNLFDKEYLQGSINNSGDFSDNTKRVTTYIDVVAGTTYTFSTSNAYIRLAYAYSGNTKVGIVTDATVDASHSLTITPAATVDKIGISLMNADSTASATNIIPSDVQETMLNYGSEALPYIPYGNSWS